jgi:uncharacterized protein (TIGR00269 family)
MKCHCGRKAVYHRRFEGKSLCKDHFLESVERKFKKSVRVNRLIKAGDRIAVAVSGGKDSTVALHLMNGIVSPRRDIELFAITVDEGIKGYRPGNIRLARKFCRKLGVKHHVVSFRERFGKTLDQRVREIGRDSRIREPCTYCGVGRRHALNTKARELGATKICTGHNLDDEAQSVVMNYLRGDLLRAGRLGPVTDHSIKKKHGEMFIPRVKPLRDIPEKECALYAVLKGFELDWRECPHISGIRFDVRDFLVSMEDKYPGIKYTILCTFDKISPCIREMASRREGEIVKCSKCGEPGSAEVCKTCELWR